jgi:hypothetical protein
MPRLSRLRLTWLALAVALAGLAFAGVAGFAHAGAPDRARSRATHARLAPSAGVQVTSTNELTPTPTFTATPEIYLLGEVDSTTAVPAVQLRFSVLDGLGGGVEDLDPDSLDVTEDGIPVDELQLAEETPGLAIVAVVDRGGMVLPGVYNRRRWDDAIVVALSLTEVLSDGTNLLGLVGVDAGGATAPTATLSTNGQPVIDALLAAEPVDEPTRLYDGICAALDVLDQPALAERRRVIVVLADSLDNASTRCSATALRDRARALDVSLFTIQLDTPPESRPRNYAPVDPTQLIWLAQQTSGRYLRFGDAFDHEALIAFFGELVTQRTQYALSFVTRSEAGAHQLALRTELPDGVAEARTTFSSVLSLPAVRLVAPESGTTFTRSRELTPSLPVFMDVEVSFPDGYARNPARVEYLINGLAVITREQQPYSAEWDAGQVPTGTYSVAARVTDGLLTRSEPLESGPAFIRVTLEAPQPPSQQELTLAWLRANLALLICLPGSVVLLVGAFLLHRPVYGMLRQSTMRVAENMPAVFGPARGRLVLTRGTPLGREFRIVKPVTILGREQALSDIALDDRYVSARHAAIRVDAEGHLTITDEGSQNGTLVNGLRIPPRQAVPLPFDATIRLGDTELVLRQTGSGQPELPS